jgi:hypothetical protein
VFEQVVFLYLNSKDKINSNFIVQKDCGPEKGP